MPTEKRRVNMAMPDDVYVRLQRYKQKYGIPTDAGACLQLVIQRLDSLEQSDMMLKAVSRFSLEELQQLSNLGIADLKRLAEQASDHIAPLRPASDL